MGSKVEIKRLEESLRNNHAYLKTKEMEVERLKLDISRLTANIDFLSYQIFEAKKAGLTEIDPDRFRVKRGTKSQPE